MISSQINDMTESDKIHMPGISYFASTELYDIMGKTNIFGSKSDEKMAVCPNYPRGVMLGGVNITTGGGCYPLLNDFALRNLYPSCRENFWYISIIKRFPK